MGLWTVDLMGMNLAASKAVWMAVQTAEMLDAAKGFAMAGMTVVGMVVGMVAATEILSAGP
jgi:hypothetical protein